MSIRMTVENMLNERARIWDQAKGLVNERGLVKAEDREQYERMNTEMRSLEDQARTLVENEERSREAAALRQQAGVHSPTRSQSESRAGKWLADEVRALTGGGNFSPFTPSEHADYFFDLLAAESVLLRSGVKVLMTDRDSLLIPHITADASAGWYGEGDRIGSTDPTSEALTAVPRKVGALVALSNELVADAQPSVLDAVSRGMIRSVGLRYDLGAFEGSGVAPQIRGLKQTAGVQVQSMGTNGAALTNLDPFADSLGMLEEANARGRTAIVMHPRTWKAAVRIKESSGSNKSLLQESTGSDGVSRTIFGTPVYLTSQLSVTEAQGTASNASSVYVYVADELYAVLRQDVKVAVDTSRLFDTDQSEVRVTMRGDLVVPNPKAVVRIAGIVPA